MALQVGELIDPVQVLLDDFTRVRTPTPMFLRHVSRAQQWVALRYRLLRHTFALPLQATIPLYDVATMLPRLVSVLSVVHDTGVPLWPVPLTSLRYTDLAWMTTPGAPTVFYRIGWNFLGVHPVPATDEVVHATAHMLPLRVEALSTLLEVPVAYAPQVVLVTAGLLAIVREHQPQGAAWIQEGLGAAALATPGGSTGRAALAGS